STATQGTEATATQGISTAAQGISTAAQGISTATQGISTAPRATTATVTGATTTNIVNGGPADCFGKWIAEELGRTDVHDPEHQAGSKGNTQTGPD
ncbi:MAG TPA: hypothetical protein VKE98_03335, partial [Gemmataceae bacterium]|nr:hypothetical protein [Gemmataceae bacterium]